MSIGVTLLMLALLIAGLLYACEAFTNAIEWLGHKLGLNEGAVGSVLAAVGTALPETLVPLVALAASAWMGQAGGGEVALGAIVGAPFMLSTLAMGVSGVAVLVAARQGLRTLEVTADGVVMERDLRFFLICFTPAMAAGFIPSRPLHLALGVALLGAYAYYVKKTLDDPGELSGMPEALHFGRNHDNPPLALVVTQVVVSLLGIALAAHFFVGRVEHLATLLAASPLILSLVITPVATELPEKFNSVLWIRARKDTLALGNVTGAMVFQSCIPVTVGLWLTPWHLSGSSMIAAGVAWLAGMFQYLQVRRTGRMTLQALLLGAVFYVAFIGYVVVKTMAPGMVP
jgi:cation:H+ antiporter